MANSKAYQAARNAKPINLRDGRQSDRRARLSRFLMCYVSRTDFDTTKAAIEAGIGDDTFRGIKRARDWAWEAWGDKWFQTQLAEHRERQAEVIKLCAIEVAKTLWIKANTSMQDVMEPEALEKAGVKPNLDPIKASCIKAINWQDAGRASGASGRVELVPNSAYTEQLGKFLGMYTAKLEVTGKMDWGEAVKAMPPQTAEELEWVIAEKQRELAQI